MKIDKRFVLNCFGLGNVYALNFLLSLILVPYVIKSIGLENWGIISFASLILNYLIWFSNWSFYQHSTKLIAAAKTDEFKCEVFSNTFYAQAGLTIVSVSILLVCSFVSENNWSVIFTYGIAVLVGNLLQPLWFLFGLEKQYIAAIFQLASKVLFAGLVIVFVNEKSDYCLYILFLGVSGILIGLIQCFYISICYKHKLLGMFKYKNVFCYIKESAQLFYASIWSTMYQSVPVLILNSIAGPIPLGVYSTAERVRSACIQLIHPLTHSIFPRMVKINEISICKHEHYLKKLLILVAIGSIVLTGLLIIFSRQIADFYTSEGVSEVAFSISLISFSILLTNLNEIYYYQYYIPKAEYSTIHRTKFKATLLMLIVCPILVFFYSASGACVSLIIAELYVFVSLLFNARSFKL